MKPKLGLCSDGLHHSCTDLEDFVYALNMSYKLHFVMRRNYFPKAASKHLVECHANEEF